MTSQLVMTFLDRGDEGGHRWLEIWVFRDGTLNLVIASESDEEDEEYSFPCAPYHLRNVLAGAPFQTAGPAGYVHMRREGDRVSASFMRATDDEGWTQELSVSDIDCCLLEAARISATYVA